MRNVIGAAVALAMLGFAGLANAEEVKGKLAAMDGGKIMLEDGTILVLAEGVTAESLKPGDWVKVTYEEKDGQMVATAIETKSGS